MNDCKTGAKLCAEDEEIVAIGARLIDIEASWFRADNECPGRVPEPFQRFRDELEEYLADIRRSLVHLRVDADYKAEREGGPETIEVVGGPEMNPKVIDMFEALKKSLAKGAQEGGE